MHNTVYISGKITGMEEQAYKNFEEAENYITSLGFNVINPMKLTHNHDKTWNSYMKECLKHLMDCDYIYLINGYEESKGAKLELYIAEELGIVNFAEYEVAQSVYELTKGTINILK